MTNRSANPLPLAVDDPTDILTTAIGLSLVRQVRLGNLKVENLAEIFADMEKITNAVEQRQSIVLSDTELKIGDREPLWNSEEDRRRDTLAHQPQEFTDSQIRLGEDDRAVHAMNDEGPVPSERG